MSELPPEKCDGCEYKETIPGNTHIKCVHPLVVPYLKSPLAELASILGKRGQGLVEIPQEVVDVLGITAIYTGIKRGWFNWPFNFDPVWLTACKGFKRKE